MKEKNAIYITQIPLNKEKTELSRTVAYSKDSFSNIVNFRGQNQSEYLVLRQIAIGMGYNVDEYELSRKKENHVDYQTFKGEMKVKESPKYNTTSKYNTTFTTSLSEGDKPVFDSQNNLMGFTRNGRFIDIHHYRRYASFKPYNNIEKPDDGNSSKRIDSDDELEL